MPPQVTLRWNDKNVPQTLRQALRACGEEYPIVRGGSKGIELTFELADTPGICEVDMADGVARIRYSQTSQAMRGVGAVLSGLVKPAAPYREKTSFTMVGVMLDCSRNAVMTIDHLKIWLRRLALLGYNTVMLYTEDTYQLPGEPLFGYARGAYTAQELKQLDDAAAQLGIDVIPCIQTLGHLEQILTRYGEYRAVQDTGGVMLVGEPKTYELIEKMVSHWASVCRSRRIHIGMDETFGLGRGQYQDRHGVRRPFDIFNEHIAQVVKICQKYGLSPMIWSDMYFRLGNEKHEYYEPDVNIPQDVINHIPKAVDLVYWDYYHAEADFYRRMIRRHRSLGHEPLMGSGIWTWDRFWYDHRLTKMWAGPCIDACLRESVKEIFFTMWGDNRAYCDHDSAFAGMAWCADRMYASGEPSDARLEKRFGAICGGSYAAHILASSITYAIPGYEPQYPMWQDPFRDMGFRRHMKDNPAKMAKAARVYDTLAKKLQGHAADRATGDLLHASRVARFIADRYDLSARLLAAYRSNNRPALKAVHKDIAKVLRSARAMADSFRNMWLAHNKPEGLETNQERFGMIEARYREMQVRLGEYLSGKIDSIAELDCPCPAKDSAKRARRSKRQ